MADSSQKFIARNRAPRVQIEYDVELYGAEKKVQLPFVMGVMSDLAGKSEVAQPSVADRKFLEIDVDNFDERMKGLAPRAVFTVPNTLTGEGSLAVDLTFEKMSDFTPGAIAARVDALQPLLLARQQLSTLMAYMDGKSGAEALIERILADPALLSAVAAQPTAEGGDIAAALETLRQITPAVPEAETTEDVLAGLRSAPTVDHTEPGRSAVLEGLRGQAQPEQSEEDQTADVLAQLSAAAPEDDPGDAAARAAVLQDLAQSAPADHDADSGQAATAAALDSLAAVSVADTPKEADTSAVLAQLAETPPGDAPPEDQADDVLAAIERRENAGEVSDGQQAALDSLAAQMPQLEETGEDLDAVLGSLSAAEPAAPEEAAQVADVLATIPEARAPDAPDEDIGSILDALPEVPAAEDADEVADRALESLAAAAPAEDAAAEAENLEDVLQGLQAAEETEDTGDDALDDILSDLAAEAPTEEQPQVDLDSLRDSLAPSEDAGATEEPDLAELLGDLAETEADAAGDEDDLAAVLAGLESTEAADPEVDIASDDAAALSDAAELSDPDDLAEEDVDPAPADDTGDDAAEDLDGLLMDLATDADDAGEDDAGDDLGALLGALDSEDEAEEADPSEDSDDLNDLDALLGDLAVADEAEEDSAGDDLDDLLSSLDLESGDEDAAEDGAESDADDLAALLGDLDAAGEDLDDLLGDGDEGDAELDLDSLLDGLGDVEEAGGAADAEDSPTDPVAEPAQPQDPEFAYGRISAARPEPQKLQRKRFRLAILGDFSGRSARGEIAIGADLAGRAARQLDVDTVEELIKGFATELVLQIGRDGDGIAVSLGGLDDLHPDELYENVALFAELVGLRKQLQSGATADHALRSLTAWGERHGTRVRPPKLRSAGNAVPADRRLSAFQQLIGDSGNRLGRVSPIEDLLAQVVGPHVRAAPSADVAACQAAVDAALSDAMRLVLHHPEFQMVEAQWRSLDLIARSIETDDTLDVMLYDISAEEMAADLAASDDLADSGLVRLLTEAPLDEENGRGGYSALIGLYQFEETPPHAELLGRIARVAAHVDAPFFAAMSAAFMDSAPEDLLPQVRNAWATLRDMPEAGHLALLSPRFLLRRPYGAKSDPIYAFDFEEFSESEGLRGMLWGNPAVLAAILLAQSFRKNGPGMGLGQVMSLGGMPYHYVNDRYGDQVALPCTERNINLDKIERAQGRGFAAVSAVKGRDELRLTSFNSLQGREILGPWTGQPVPAPSPPDPRSASTGGDSDVDAETDDLDLDDLDLEADSDLDDLLAGFDDDDAADDDADSDDMDDELAALLDDL